jgi:hypothetical protein
MKATLAFNLDDPEDRAAHLRAVKADNYHEALERISRQVFNWEENLDEGEKLSPEEISKAVSAILEDTHVDLWEAQRT